MADDGPEDNIVRLDEARAKRKRRRDELDDAAVAQMLADSAAKLAALVVRFNAEYAVVNETGKVWAFRWRHDPALKRHVLERIRYQPDFKDMYANETLTLVELDPKTKKPLEVTKSVAEWWWKNPARRQYLGGVTLDPIGPVPTGYWNLWLGFGVTAAPGNWSLMHDHIVQVLCSGNPAYADYVFNWMARAVQHPNEPGEVALVFRGKKGCGKGIVGRWFVSLFGQHGMQITSPMHLVGRFNYHLRDLSALFGDESFFAGDRKHEGILNGLITEPLLAVEGKGRDLITVLNMLHIMLASNFDWVIPVTSDERRYGMFDVPDTKIGQFAYFKAIDDQMKNGGCAAMLHALLARNISNFEVRNIPQTAALATQKKLSLDTLDQWLLAVLERGFVWRSRYGVPEFSAWDPDGFYSTELLLQSYLQWCGDSRVAHPASRQQLGARMAEIYSPSRPEGEQIIGELETWPPNKTQADLVVRKYRPHGYLMRDFGKEYSLDEARAKFSEMRGVTGNWRATW
jgi:Family of unknown function (DUF5906)